MRLIVSIETTAGDTRAVDTRRQSYARRIVQVGLWSCHDQLAGRHCEWRFNDMFPLRFIELIQRWCDLDVDFQFVIGFGVDRKQKRNRFDATIQVSLLDVLGK